MNDHLRERINRRLDALTDERAYQVLDYIEFLESKYAERQTPQSSAFTRFTEAVEDRLRAGKVSAAAIAETMGLLNRAANVLNGAVAAGKSVASDIVNVAQNVGAPRPSGGTTPATGPAVPNTPTTSGSGPATPPPTRDASSTAHDVKQPGSGEERL
jgi:hypothetical protein